MDFEGGRKIMACSNPDCADPTNCECESLAAGVVCECSVESLCQCCSEES